MLIFEAKQQIQKGLNLNTPPFWEESKARHCQTKRYEWAKNNVGLNFSKIVEKYLDGTLTDVELEEAEYNVDNVKKAVKVWLALEKGIPKVSFYTYVDKGGISVKVPMSGKFQVWDRETVFDMTRTGWTSTLEFVCVTIMRNIEKETGIKVAVPIDERKFKTDIGGIHISWR